MPSRPWPLSRPARPSRPPSRNPTNPAPYHHQNPDNGGFRVDELEICYMSAADLGHRIRMGEISPVEVVEAHLSRIRATEPTLNSFITLLPEAALAAARQAERDIAAGRYRGPLHGIPVALKDLFHTGGVRTTSGSRIYDTFIPARDCTVAARLREAGAILLGKLNMHQFAYGPTGENPDYGHMHNPWNPDLVSGGSSGGSGSAAAAGQCPITTGSDTGGSIRIPAALCGIAGLKPTYGLVPVTGVEPLAWSLDHLGPLAASVEDCAFALEALAGGGVYTSELGGRVQGMRIGVLAGGPFSPMAPDAEAAFRAAVEVLAELGAVPVELDIPELEYTLDAEFALVGAEAAARHRRLLRDRPELIDPAIRQVFMAGTLMTASHYLKGRQAREVIRAAVRREMEGRRLDLLASPALPAAAVRPDQIGRAHV